jgi:hypothetical protein
MAKSKKWYTAVVNFTKNQIYYAQEWPDKESAIHQDQLNELTAALNVAGSGAEIDGITPIPAGDDWQAYGPEEMPFSFPD